MENIQVQEEVIESIDRSNAIALSESLRRLENNPDFKLVILDGYLKNKVLNTASLLSNEQIKVNGQRQYVVEELIATATLNQYFLDTHNLGALAKDDQESIERGD